MIDSVVIADASYSRAPQTFGPLREINLLYGPNGSGKTTISRTLAEADRTASKVTWSSSGPLRVHVFNCDFVSHNFGEFAEIAGVFTLGEESIELVDRIREATAGREQRREKRANLHERMRERKQALERHAKDLADKCWEGKAALSSTLRDAFKGYHSDKKKFRNRCLELHERPPKQTRALDELSEAWATVFGESPKHVELLPVVDVGGIVDLPGQSLLGRPIVGSAAVPASELITRLENSDWVRRGLKHVQDADGRCPFCQQALSDALVSELKSVFDEGYEQARDELNKLRESYALLAKDLLRTLSLLDNTPADALHEIDVRDLRLAAQSCNRVLTDNLQLIDSKVERLGMVVALEPLEDAFEDLAALVRLENDARAAFNESLKDLARTKEALRLEVWDFMLNEGVGEACRQYVALKKPLDKALDGISNAIRKQDEEISTLSKEIAELEAERTSIVPTAERINHMLAALGFDSFHLEVADEGRAYRIVRPGGEDALKTLSEGERSLVTFLYFFRLASGSDSNTGVSDPRVVVIDDPVSSLDSQTLFVVSTLVRDLIELVQNDESPVKQLFVLTHNVHFHREVAFGSDRSSCSWRNLATHWSVAREQNGSVLRSHAKSPVSTSYELSWAEALATEGRSATVRNAMRRVLETYFKLVGPLQVDKVLPSIEPEDRAVVKSLMSWVNAGSHAIDDDIYSSTDMATIDTYQRAFKTVFRLSGHGAHYDLMREAVTVDAP